MWRGKGRGLGGERGRGDEGMQKIQPLSRESRDSLLELQSSLGLVLKV